VFFTKPHIQLYCTSLHCEHMHIGSNEIQIIVLCLNDFKITYTIWNNTFCLPMLQTCFLNYFKKIECPWANTVFIYKSINVLKCHTLTHWLPKNFSRHKFHTVTHWWPSPYTSKKKITALTIWTMWHSNGSHKPQARFLSQLWCHNYIISLQEDWASNKQYSPVTC
jgi:hypothetical protein